MFLQKVLPRAISAVLCLLMLHYLSAFLWSDSVCCCWMWGALTVQSASGKGQWRKKIRKDSALWMEDMVQECRDKTCYKSLCKVKWLLTRCNRYHHISFTFCAFQRYSFSFSYALDVNVPWWPPLMKDWAQQLLMVLRAGCLRSAKATSPPQSPAAGWWAGSSQWDIDAGLHAVLLSWAVCTKKFSFPDSHLQPEALMLQEVKVTCGVRKYMVIITLVPVLWLLGYNRGICHFLTTWNPWCAFSASTKFLFLPCSKSGVEQTFKVIWTHKNI